MSIASLETRTQTPDPDGNYDPWHPPSGLDAFQESVERYLYSRDVSRLALRCLSLLRQDTSVAGDSDAYRREPMPVVLRSALADLPGADR